MEALYATDIATSHDGNSCDSGCHLNSDLERVGLHYLASGILANKALNGLKHQLVCPFSNSFHHKLPLNYKLVVHRHVDHLVITAILVFPLAAACTLRFLKYLFGVTWVASRIVRVQPFQELYFVHRAILQIEIRPAETPVERICSALQSFQGSFTKLRKYFWIGLVQLRPVITWSQRLDW